MLLIMLRPARPEDVDSIRSVEREADGVFATVGVHVDGEVMPADEVLAAIDAGQAWVVEVDGEVVAGAVAGLVDGGPHLHQLSCRPAHGRRGHGAALVEAVAEWAGAGRLTLTTFRDVPFNAPFYERLGFVVIEPEPGTELAAIAADEARRFPDPRVCMRR